MEEPDFTPLVWLACIGMATVAATPFVVAYLIWRWVG